MLYSNLYNVLIKLHPLYFSYSSCSSSHLIFSLLFKYILSIYYFKHSLSRRVMFSFYLTYSYISYSILQPASFLSILPFKTSINSFIKSKMMLWRLCVIGFSSAPWLLFITSRIILQALYDAVLLPDSDLNLSIKLSVKLHLIVVTVSIKTRLSLSI